MSRGERNALFDSPAPRRPESRAAASWVGRLARLLAVGAYVVTLHVIYVQWISPLFDYRGFSDHGSGVGDWFLLACVLGVFTITLPSDLARPNKFVSWWLFLTLAVPVTLMPLYQPGDVQLEMWAFAILAGAAATVFGRLDRLPQLERPTSG